MILKGVKAVGVHQLPDGTYSYDLEIPDGVEFGEQKWIRPATHAGWGWNDLSEQYIGVVSCGTGGKGAGLFAIRAADSHPGAMYSGDDWLAVQDMPASVGYNTVYGRYGEVWRKAKAADGTPVDPRSIAQGDEMAVVNEQPTVRVDPFNSNREGLCEGYRVMAEGLGDGPHYNPSVGITIGSGGTAFDKGYNVAHNAIAADGELIALAEGTAFVGFYKLEADGTVRRTARLTVIDGKLKLLKEGSNETAVDDGPDPFI